MRSLDVARSVLTKRPRVSGALVHTVSPEVQATPGTWPPPGGVGGGQASDSSPQGWEVKPQVGTLKRESAGVPFVDNGVVARLDSRNPVFAFIAANASLRF